MRIVRSLLALVIGIAITSPPRVLAQTVPQAFVGAHLIPITGPDVADGVLIVRDGRISAVGPTSSTPIPDDAERHDATGLTIMPGLVDTHSHIGNPEGGDRSAAFHASVRVLDSVNVRDARFQKAQAGGITTVNIMPGSGHLLSGQTVYAKLRDGKTLEELMLYREDGQVAGGMKMANGTNPRRQPPFPGTRAKAAALVREQFLAALDYRRRTLQADDASEQPARDLQMEGLLEVLDGTRVVHHHTHRHDDILTVLRLADEFGFRTVLHHVSDAWAVAEEIAEAGVASSLVFVDSPGGKLEAKDSTFLSGAALERAGATVGFHTDDGITDSRFFLRQAGLAVRAGMTRAGALYGLTMAGAGMLELEDRIGSLDVGKDADFIVLSGDPLSVYTKVLETWVDGSNVFDRSTPADRLYAVGGYGASHDQGVFQELEWEAR